MNKREKGLFKLAQNRRAFEVGQISEDDYDKNLLAINTEYRKHFKRIIPPKKEPAARKVARKVKGSGNPIDLGTFCFRISFNFTSHRKNSNPP